VSAANAPVASSRLSPRLAATIAFVVALAAIVGAWGSQIFGGLVPCELCLEQRLPYYFGLPLLALLLLFWQRLPRMAWYGLVAAVLALFAWGLYLGIYHAGVEWRFWPGPTACTGTGLDVSFEDLSNINATRIVPCDAVQFRFLGISLAGYNALVMAGAIALLGYAAAKGRKAG
jgi:disulfide bond formation protein DsbB